MKAADSAAFCVEDLRGAIGKATPIQSLIIGDLLRQSTDLSHKLAMTRDAIESEHQASKVAEI
ncbi:hypothetical protein KBY65_12690 [Cyanobium sp. Alchichica 3B3-8F6]|uniref:hypothetical protein n=1 Tax=Cyanobium sp. Alchichica 3B3-8F6 TaxID=2823696 RepID=UPI0020CC8AF0|nr:hypothetical protein [Cyanobium sp. Alchichica 3B3-8F6]MCP9883318.1 hypothetical protein [Cyanobium sp. Alchichica 3B3-8F6]